MKKVLVRTLLAILGVILILVANFFIFQFAATRISEGDPIDASTSNRTALIIIDLQEGTTGDISYTESYQDQSEDLIRITNRIIDSALSWDWLWR